jgi:tetratricopeptide (TPR) repeat protein
MKSAALLLLAVAATWAQSRGANLPEPLRQAQSLARQGKHDEAILVYSAYLQENPKSIPALTGMANLLDVVGQNATARNTFQRALALAETPAQKAQITRGMALSYAFENDCANAAKLLETVYQYQVTAGDAYQQGEMLNEAARICLEAGAFDQAEHLYRRGTEAGLKEKDIKTERAALWSFRLEHALARLAARRGQRETALKHVATARLLLDGNAELAQQQEIFYPYLTGYVALYTGEPAKAITELAKANQSDPFIQILLGMAHEKLGHAEQAESWFAKAATTTGHNPPAAFALYYTRQRRPQ